MIGKGGRLQTMCVMGGVFYLLRRENLFKAVVKGSTLGPLEEIEFCGKRGQMRDIYTTRVVQSVN